MQHVLFDIKQASIITGLSRKSLKKLVSLGVINSYISGRRNPLFSQVQLEELLKKNLMTLKKELKGQAIDLLTDKTNSYGS